jgi:hypothetical protein
LQPRSCSPGGGREYTRSIDLPSLFASIGIERDYSALDLNGLSLDLQGWGHDRPIFPRVMEEVRPEVVIEVGTWKGASTVRMHGLARALGLNTHFICVDTWLGSSEHWLGAKDRSRLRLRGGYPDLYRQFIFNLIASNATDVFPLPMASLAAAQVLSQLGVQADLIYVDAGHDEREVFADLSSYFPLLRAGGVIFGDDYTPDWPGLVRAVDTFFNANGLQPVIEEPTWLVRNTLTGAAADALGS